MNLAARAQIMAGFSASNAEENLRAIEQVRQNSDVGDIPWLLDLLQHESFLVREAAAWPLAELAGPSVLCELLNAYQQGIEEGHDNDGFAAALFELVELHPVEAQAALQLLANDGDSREKENAAWLLEYFQDEVAQLGVQADAVNGAA
jgi:HEAT repeat protein